MCDAEDDGECGRMPKTIEERCLGLVQQYLDECGYTEALAALERESGRKYRRDAESTNLGSELMCIVQQTDEAAAAEANARDPNATPDPELSAAANGNVANGDATATLTRTHTANVLCVRLLPTSDKSMQWVISGSSDKSVAATSWRDGGAVVWRTALPSAPISIDCSDSSVGLVLVGTMGGTSHVIVAATGELLQTFSEHRKYVVAAKWVRGGSAFVTASHDHRVVLFSRASAEFTKEREWTFPGCVEAVAVLGGGAKVAVSVREDNRLHSIDLASGAVDDLLNMNATGDDHVSFTALDLSVSPSGRHLLVSTDRDRLILFDLARNGAQVRNFWGATNDELSQPRHCWDPSGQYVYSTSQDNLVHAWEVATQRTAAKLAGHKKMVRAIDFGFDQCALATGGYDATIRVWSVAIDQ